MPAPPRRDALISPGAARVRFPLVLFGSALVLLVPAPAATRADEAEFFERDIRPLLVEKCQSCHGGKKTGGGLGLARRDALVKGGDRGPAVVPGKPGESLLVQAVGRAGDLKMPPKGPLSAQEIERLTRWVARGAVWPEAARAARPPGVTETQRRWW